MTYICRDERSV